MTNIDIIMRLGAGMLIGILVGIEREHSQRPAGMRTHCLVALGASAVTIAGMWLAESYSSDPMRLAAQVVSGIGFLGAGTIIKEGANIRGLTTAASLWVTACLAIVAGIGLYIAAAAGTIGILVALMVLNKVERRISRQQHISSALLEITAVDADTVINALGALSTKFDIEPRGMTIENTDSGAKIEVRMRSHSRATLASVFADVSAIEGVKRAHIRHADE